ncbi:MAG: hypothetical protein ACLU4N_21330 [Butyricimonas faecihominis]
MKTLLMIEVLEFDYDLSTLEDLFYFPNLKKVVLGKTGIYTRRI